jgi:Flp pilus assembly CpaF family ATPase
MSKIGPRVWQRSDGAVHRSVDGRHRAQPGGAEATSAPQQMLISEAVNVVIFIDAEKSSKAGRKVREVIVVMGYQDGRYLFERV